MKRIGAVITFKPEVTEPEAARALRSIGFLLDTPETVSKPSDEVQTALDAGSTVRYNPGQWIDVRFHHIDLVREFDDDFGGPVWYIP